MIYSHENGRERARQNAKCANLYSNVIAKYISELWLMSWARLNAALATQTTIIFPIYRLASRQLSRAKNLYSQQKNAKNNFKLFIYSNDDEFSNHLRQIKRRIRKRNVAKMTLCFCALRPATTTFNSRSQAIASSYASFASSFCRVSLKLLMLPKNN
jgi:hypothetical protein